MKLLLLFSLTLLLLYGFTLTRVKEVPPVNVHSPAITPDTGGVPLVRSIKVDTLPSVTDVDGNTYGVIAIVAHLGPATPVAGLSPATTDSLVWLSSNLSTTHYRNGVEIPQARSTDEWTAYCKKKTGCWCYYNNDPALGAKYGKLYNFYAVCDPVNNIAPEGFHVATNNDLATLTGPLGYNTIGSKLRSTSGWDTVTVKKEKKKERLCGNGTNESGFNALPAGYRNQSGSFDGLGNSTYWWALEPTSGGQLVMSRGVFSGSEILLLENHSPWMGYSVRCVKDHH